MAAGASLEVPDGSIVHQGGPIEHWSREPGLGLKQRIDPFLRSLCLTFCCLAARWTSSSGTGRDFSTSITSLPFNPFFRLGSESSGLGGRVGLGRGGGSLKGACSEKGKVVCSELLFLVSPSLAGTLSNPTGLFFVSSVYLYLLQKEFLPRGSLLQYSLGRRDHQKGPQMTMLG